MGKVQALKSAAYVLPEALAWMVGLVLLACMEPGASHLFSLCPVSWFWESGCPGCGLGNSVAYLIRGEMYASWQSHPLGSAALLLLTIRIIRLGSLSCQVYRHHHYM